MRRGGTGAARGERYCAQLITGYGRNLCCGRGQSIVLRIGTIASDTLDIGFAKQIAVLIVFAQLLQRLLLPVWRQQGTLTGKDRRTETQQELVAIGCKIDYVGMPRQGSRDCFRLAQEPGHADTDAVGTSDSFAQLARSERV